MNHGHGHFSHGHGHGHGHGQAESPIPLGPIAAKIVVGLLAAIGLLVLFGTALLWPSSRSVDIPAPFQTSGGGAVVTEAGMVVEQNTGPCGSPSFGRVFTGEPSPPSSNTFDCERSIVAIESGPDDGATAAGLEGGGDVHGTAARPQQGGAEEHQETDRGQ